MAIYGAGNLGKLACEFLMRTGNSPDLVVDVNPSSSARDPFWSNTRVLAPHEVPTATRATHLLAVTIANLPYGELAGVLSRQGWTDIVPFYDVSEAYREFHPLSNGWVLDDIDEMDVASTLETLDNWSDDISRAHHLQFMAWHKTGKDWVFLDAPVNTQDRYFIPEVIGALGKQQAFMDVGAHKGETTQKICALQGIAVRQTWLIEPDPANAAEAERSIMRLPAQHRDRSRLFHCAVSARTCHERFFAGLGYASQLSPLGSDLVEVLTIDDLSVEPTFIKLHLEGHELDALHGAESTLRATRPIIAATAYHNKLGLWRLPLWLMNLSLNYNYYFRLHNWCGTGAVVYCIPRDAQRVA